MHRRRLFTSTLLAGVATAAATASAGEQGGTASERGLERISDAIAGLRDELRAERQFADIAPIRAAQKTFLRANGKLPDFLELGSDVWFAVYDWHVRWQLPVVDGRDPQGRPTMTLNHTQLVLRADTTANYVGLPYDAR